MWNVKYEELNGMHLRFWMSWEQLGIQITVTARYPLERVMMENSFLCDWVTLQSIFELFTPENTTFVNNQEEK